MKKIVTLALVFLMIALMLSGCAKPAAKNGAASVDAFKTIGDIIATVGEAQQSACYDNVFVYVFEIDGVPYRAISNITEDVSSAIFDLEYDDDYDKNYKAIITPLKVDKIEALSDQKLSEEEMKAFVGKSGQNLLDAGWSSGYGYNLDNSEFWMNYGPFCYTVIFEEDISEEDYEDFDSEEGIKDLTVKSVEFSGLGDATNIDTEE